MCIKNYKECEIQYLKAVQLTNEDNYSYLSNLALLLVYNLGEITKAKPYIEKLIKMKGKFTKLNHFLFFFCCFFFCFELFCKFLEYIFSFL